MYSCPLPPWPVCIVTACRCCKESLVPAVPGWIQEEERIPESLLDEHYVTHALVSM